MYTISNFTIGSLSVKFSPGFYRIHSVIFLSPSAISPLNSIFFWTNHRKIGYDIEVCRQIYNSAEFQAIKADIGFYFHRRNTKEKKERGKHVCTDYQQFK